MQAIEDMVMLSCVCVKSANSMGHSCRRLTDDSDANIPTCSKDRLCYGLQFHVLQVIVLLLYPCNLVDVLQGHRSDLLEASRRNLPSHRIRGIAQHDQGFSSRRSTRSFIDSSCPHEQPRRRRRFDCEGEGAVRHVDHKLDRCWGPRNQVSRASIEFLCKIDGFDAASSQRWPNGR